MHRFHKEKCLCGRTSSQLGDSQADVSRFEAEQRAAEQMAKANGYWIPMMDVFNLGVSGPMRQRERHFCWRESHL